jgi:hypothetical protein
MTEEARFCAVPVKLWCANGSTARVYSNVTRRIDVVPTQCLNLLRHNTFEYLRTLDDHVSQLVDAATRDSGRVAEGDDARGRSRIQLRRLLEDLAADGLLISEEQVQGALLKGAGDGRREPITRVCITTLRQPRVLADCIATSGENARLHGRRLEYVVLDDLRSNEHECDSAAWLSKQCAPSTLSYVRSGHLRDYCHALSIEADVDPHVVVSGLMPAESLRRTDGACKNALMLDAASERYLQVDDDIQWRVGASSASSRYLRVYDGVEPMETTYYRSRAAALDAANWQEIDFVGAHDAVLGKSLPAVAAGATESREMAFVGRVAPVLSSLMASDCSSVRATFAGLAGDPATEFPSYRTLLEESRHGLVASRSEYAALRLTREVIRVAPTLTVAKPGWAMAFAMGCDATTLLPPFFPLGRSYEKVFSVLLSRCWPSAWVGFLPVFVLHSPLARRQFDADAFVQGVVSVRLPDLVAVLLSSAKLEPWGQPAERMRRLGQQLVEMGEAETFDFDELLFAAMFLHRSRQLNLYSKALTMHPEGPAWWADDVRTQIAALEVALERRPMGQLHDYPALGHDGDYAGLQRVLRDFGELLRAWPRLFEAAGILKRGERSLRNLPLRMKPI